MAPYNHLFLPSGHSRAEQPPDKIYFDWNSSACVVQRLQKLQSEEIEGLQRDQVSCLFAPIAFKWFY